MRAFARFCKPDKPPGMHKLSKSFSRPSVFYAYRTDAQHPKQWHLLGCQKPDARQASTLQHRDCLQDARRFFQPRE